MKIKFLCLFLIYLFFSCNEESTSNQVFNISDYNIEMLKDEIEILRTSIKNCYLESRNRYKSEYNAYESLNSCKELIFKNSINPTIIDSNINYTMKIYMIERGIRESNSNYFENHIRKVNLNNISDKKNVQLAGLIKIKNAYYLLALHSCTSERDMGIPPVFR